MAFLEAALIPGHPEHERMVAQYGIRAGLAGLTRLRRGARRGAGPTAATRELDRPRPGAPGDRPYQW